MKEQANKKYISNVKGTEATPENLEKLADQLEAEKITAGSYLDYLLILKTATYKRMKEKNTMRTNNIVSFKIKNTTWTKSAKTGEIIAALNTIYYYDTAGNYRGASFHFFKAGSTPAEQKNNIYILSGGDPDLSIFDRFNEDGDILSDTEYKKLEAAAKKLYDTTQEAKNNSFKNNACFISSNALHGFFFPNLNTKLRAIAFINRKPVLVYDNEE